MNKYLTTKIENSKGVLVKQMCLIAFEVINEERSELIQEFETLEYSKICKVLNWTSNGTVHEQIGEEITEGGLSGMMFRNNRTGFLAEVLIPVCTNIETKGDSLEPARWKSSQGVCYSDYVYADSVGELTDKAIALSDHYFRMDWAKQINLQPLKN